MRIVRYIVMVEFGDDNDYAVGPFESYTEAQDWITEQKAKGGRGPHYGLYELVSRKEAEREDFNEG